MAFRTETGADPDTRIDRAASATAPGRRLVVFGLGQRRRGPGSAASPCGLRARSRFGRGRRCAARRKSCPASVALRIAGGAEGEPFADRADHAVRARPAPPRSRHATSTRPKAPSDAGRPISAIWIALDQRREAPDQVVVAAPGAEGGDRPARGATFEQVERQPNRRAMRRARCRVSSLGGGPVERQAPAVHARCRRRRRSRNWRRSGGWRGR